MSKEVDEAAILAFGRIFGNFACAILFHLRKPSIWCGVLTLRRFEYMIMGEPKIQFANFEAQLLLFGGGGVMHSNSKNEHIYLPKYAFLLAEKYYLQFQIL